MPASPYSGSPATGWPIASRWARIWCVRPVSSRTPQQRASGSASLDLEVRDLGARRVGVRRMRVRTRRSRPSGASIVPVRAGGRPSTSARYSRFDLARLERAPAARRGLRRRARRRAARCVSRSRRWTMPGRPDRRRRPRRRAPHERPVAWPAPGARRPPPACRRRAGARPRQTIRAGRAAVAGSMGARVALVDVEHLAAADLVALARAARRRRAPGPRDELLRRPRPEARRAARRAARPPAQARR